MDMSWRTTSILVLVLLFGLPLGDGGSWAAKPCDIADLANASCSTTEVCNEQTTTCECKEGFIRQNATFCVERVSITDQSTPNYSSLVDNQGNGSIVAGILTPIFLIAVVMCGVYASRKYHLVAWVRSKLNRRNENYDEFMIGQDLDDDDPPLE